MKVLITGVYGFLGSHLAEKLSKDHDVIGLYHFNRNNKYLANVPCYENLQLINSTPQVVVMCHASVASGNEMGINDALYTSNVQLTEKIVKKFPEAKLIYISSVSVFENQQVTISELSALNPVTDYAISKYWGERIVQKFKDSVIIRLSSLYGKGMKENTLIPNYCNMALQTGEIVLWGAGERIQNYIHVNDVSILIQRVLEKNLSTHIPLLGVNIKGYSNMDIANIVANITGAKIKFVGEDNSKSYVYNNTVTRQISDWCPEVEIAEGIKQYIEWKKK